MNFIYSFLLLLVCQNCIAKTYYISPNGNDVSGNGSISSPWKSLYKATSNVTAAGDIIHVLAGTYLEIIQSDLAAGVSLEGDGQHNTIIKSTITSVWTPLLVASSGKEGELGNQSISNIKFDGQQLATSWGIIISGRSNFSIYNCTFIDFKNRGVTFTGRIDNNGLPPETYARGNSFYNNTIINCAEYVYDSYGSGCLNIGGQEGMLIYNNTISQVNRAEGHNGWPIKYTNDGFLKGCKIFNNKITKIPMGNHPGINGWDFAIELFNVSGLEIYGNTIQGSIDLNNLTKDKFDYSVWIHDNTISQPILNKYVETGITLEFGIESAIIEGNKLINLGVPIYFTPRQGSIIKNVIIRNNTCENIGVANGTHHGLGIRIGEDAGRTYYLENLIVRDNNFIGNKDERPYWGIGISGIIKATHIDIRQNKIENFSAGCITINPAKVIDSMFVVGNILSNNGYANKAAFYNGSPRVFIFKNNTLNQGAVFTYTNLKMNLVRPLYYELKSSDMLVFITVFAFFIGLLFMIKEHIYTFPVFIIYSLIGIVLNMEDKMSLFGAVNIFFAIACIYGWFKWSTRDRQKHRIVRISKSTNKEKFFQVSLFGIISGLLLLLHFINKPFAFGIIAWAEAVALATAITGMWLIINKKIESWFWWVITCLISFPLYFFKHQIITSFLFGLLLLLVFWGMLVWKKELKIKKESAR